MKASQASTPKPTRNTVGRPDGVNKKVQIVDRQTLEVVGWFGGRGGRGFGEFFHIHSISIDSKGNVYLGESFGQRVYRWSYKGM